VRHSHRQQGKHGFWAVRSHLLEGRGGGVEENERRDLCGRRSSEVGDFCGDSCHHGEGCNHRHREEDHPYGLRSSRPQGVRRNHRHHHGEEGASASGNGSREEVGVACEESQTGSGMKCERVINQARQEDLRQKCSGR
jgi:hypothetical protein